MIPHALHRDLAGALLRHAVGLTSDTAAAELICAHHIPVHLAQVLGSLDHANIGLVTTAITRANR